MREFAKEMAAGNADKAITYLTEDMVWVTPYGTYKGKGEAKQVLAAMARNMKNMKFTETGNGIIVQGDKAFFEHVLSGTFQGNKYEMLSMCAYEFSGEKVKAMRTVYDRLLIAQQVASGWPAKPMINMIVRQSEKAMK
jgi:protein involved in ribonucleotide reduction